MNKNKTRPPTGFVVDRVKLCSNRVNREWHGVVSQVIGVADLEIYTCHQNFLDMRLCVSPDHYNVLRRSCIGFDLRVKPRAYCGDFLVVPRSVRSEQDSGVDLPPVTRTE